MSDDADDILEKWLDSGKQLLEARKGSAREKQLEDRIANLESRFDEQPARERVAALADLDDDERELIKQHRAGKATPVVEEEAEPEIEETTPRRTRPGRKSGEIYEYTVDEQGRVQRVDIPTVYSGADEADEVELPDDEQEENAA